MHRTPARPSRSHPIHRGTAARRERRAESLRFALACLTCAAVAPGAGAVTLPQFVAEVIDANPEVQEQVHVYRQVIEDHRIAESGWRPSVDVSASYGLFSEDNPGTRRIRNDFDSSKADLTVTQNLFDGFDTSNQTGQARARISSAVHQLHDIVDNIALEGIRAYIDVLRERQLVDLAEENVASHALILSQIRELDAQGIARRSDLEQTEGRLASAEASLVAQQNNLADAQSRLHRILGRYLDVSEMDEPGLPPLPEADIEGLIDASLAGHPAISSARNNIDAARYDYRRSRRTNFPRLDLQVQQSVGNDIDGQPGNTDDRSVLLQLKYNLYRGGADQAEQRKKIGVVHENQAFLDRVRRQVIDTLRLAWTADVALREQLPYLDRHVEKSRDTLELYRGEFQLQKRDLIDVLNAESELNRAKVRATESRYAALAARYRIHEGLGRLLEALDLDVNVTDDEFRVGRVSASGTNAPEPAADCDGDGQADDRDQCVSSTSGAVVDAYGCQSQPQLRLGFGATNRPPVANDDVLATERDAALTIPRATLVANDVDPDGHALVVESHDQPAHGLLEADADGNLIFVPAAGFEGEDGFGYRITDRRGGTAAGRVVVRVGRQGPPGFPPVEIVNFGYKQLTLTAESQARIDPLIERLARQPDVLVEVYAYTDNVGPKSYNLELSERRAEAMKQMLVERGVEPDRIRTFGMGEADPVADNATDEGRARNRRGEFRFTIR